MTVSPDPVDLNAQFRRHLEAAIRAQDNQSEPVSYDVVFLYSAEGDTMRVNSVVTLAIEAALPNEYWHASVRLTSMWVAPSDLEELVQRTLGWLRLQRANQARGLVEEAIGDG